MGRVEDRLSSHTNKLTRKVYECLTTSFTRPDAEKLILGGICLGRVMMSVRCRLTEDVLACSLPHHHWEKAWGRVPSRGVKPEARMP
jgi:hypothetical protein